MVFKTKGLQRCRIIMMWFFLIYFAEECVISEWLFQWHLHIHITPVQAHPAETTAHVYQREAAWIQLSVSVRLGILEYSVSTLPAGLTILRASTMKHVNWATTLGCASVVLNGPGRNVNVSIILKFTSLKKNVCFWEFVV
jgi:hypothetical protein